MKMTEERMAQVMLFCYEGLGDLVKHGFLQGGNYEVSEEGKKEIEKLEAAGLGATEKEIEYVMNRMFAEGVIEVKL